jgi:hypothetical protein
MLHSKCYAEVILKLNPLSKETLKHTETLPQK